MLKIEIKPGESIERALKRFKQKCNRTKLVQEMRERQQFIKPSVKRRQEVKKAVYIQNLKDKEERD